MTPNVIAFETIVLAPIKVYGLRYMFAEFALPGGRPLALSVAPPDPKNQTGIWGVVALPGGSGFGWVGSGIGFGMRFRVWDKGLGWGWAGLGFGFGFGCHEGI